MPTGMCLSRAQLQLVEGVLRSGSTPEVTLGSLMGKVMAYTMETAGAPIVKGGAGQVAATFEKILQSAIGEVRG